MSCKVSGLHYSPTIGYIQYENNNASQILFIFTCSSMFLGHIIAIRGVVIDLQFEDNIPKIYDAITVTPTNSNGDIVVIEVLQQLQNGIVRGIAMTSTDGLKRGDPVVNTGAPITVPVGPEVLGGIYNVL